MSQADKGYTMGQGVKVVQGQERLYGVVVYTTPDNYVGVRLEGETTVHEWPMDRVLWL